MREEWIKDRLQNCIKLKSGDGLTAKNMKSQGSIPVYGGNGYVGNHNIHNIEGENIIIGRVGAQCGNVRFLDEKIWLTDNAFHITEYKYDYDYQFLTYLLNYINLRQYARQSAQPVISNSSIKDVILTFPRNILEQKQIVTLLDKAFAAIDQAKANIEKNIENARELFQSKLDEVFAGNDDWKEIPLKEITSKIGSGATPKGGKNSYKESGISLIRSLNVYDEGFSVNNLAFIDDNQAEKLNNVIVESGDILLNITGASIARCCLAPEEYLPARVNQHVSIIRLNGDSIDNNFLHYSLISKTNKKKLLQIGEQGSTRQAITKSQIENFKVRYPINHSDQIKIVEKLNLIKDNISKMMRIYSDKSDFLEQLKRSLLDKAFKGELSHRQVENIAPLDMVAEDEAPYNDTQ